MYDIKESSHLLKSYQAPGIVPGLEPGGQGGRREMIRPSSMGSRSC